MITNQKQSAESGSTAIQASGDVTINHGMTAGQMAEIFDQVSRSILTHTEAARNLIEDRLSLFRDELVSRIAASNGPGTNAFGDPDFQAMVYQAQVTFVRDGSRHSLNLLVNLMAQRATQPQRGRVLLTLNEATNKVGSISQKDINIITMMFFLSCADFMLFSDSFDEFAAVLSTLCEPFYCEIQYAERSKDYLLEKGLIKLDMEETDDRDQIDPWKYLFDVSGMNFHLLRRPDPDGPTDWDVEWSDGESGDDIGLGELRLKNYESNLDMFISEMRVRSSTFLWLFDLLNIEFFHTHRLTAVGTALAHANLSAHTEFEGEISRWIAN